jgi:multicomponent K+:H+ antiporter subunit A
MGFVGVHGCRAPAGYPRHAAGERGVLVGWLLLLGATAAGVALHRQRFVAVIVTGVVGLIVSIGFVLLSAPDLA